jgi:hypothetical protein
VLRNGSGNDLADARRIIDLIHAQERRRVAYATFRVLVIDLDGKEQLIIGGGIDVWLGLTFSVENSVCSATSGRNFPPSTPSQELKPMIAREFIAPSTRCDHSRCLQASGT